MKNLLLAAAFLTMAAGLSRAEDGSDAFAVPAGWRPAALNAPANGPAFIDPDFTAADEEALPAKTAEASDERENVFSIADAASDPDLRDGVAEAPKALIDIEMP